MKAKTSMSDPMLLNLFSATLRHACLLAALTFVLPLGAADSPTPPPANTATNKPDVVFVPTPQTVVDKMLEMAAIKPGDVVYDLGCGDGRIVVTAAKRYSVKGVGFDIDPQRIKESLANVRSNKVEHLVSIQQKDIFKLDLSEATVVCLYLLPSLNVRLMPQLEKLRPGSRILSHDFDMEGAKPLQTVKIPPENGMLDEDDLDSHEHTIYKWVVPWERTRTAPSPPGKQP